MAWLYVSGLGSSIFQPSFGPTLGFSSPKNKVSFSTSLLNTHLVGFFDLNGNKCSECQGLANNGLGGSGGDRQLVAVLLASLDRTDDSGVI